MFVSDLASVQSKPLDIKPALPAVRHRIRGTHHADAPVAGIEVLMHRFVELDEWHLRSAGNAFWRLYCPISRGGCISFQETKQSLLPGYLYLISPHTSFDSRCSRPFGKWYLHFNVGGLLEACRPGILQIRPTARMRALLTRVCPTSRPAQRLGKLAINPLESLELAMLTVQHALPMFRLLSSEDSSLTHCIAHLREHLAERVTLTDLTRVAGVSARSLSHRFVRELGFPPMRYLIELRLNHAMKLLRHTDQTVEQIADRCGFSNRYYFTRMLSKYRKTTPAAFRARSKGG